MTAAGLILSGGASRRMGHPKALLVLEGETFLDRLIRVFGACCDPVIVVLGYHEKRIREGCRRLGDATVVVNPEPELGQLSSMQCGLRAVPSGCDVVLFTPVDYPRIEVSTLETLVDECAGDVDVAVPECGGKHGHPVCISTGLIAELLALPPESQAREVIHRHKERTRYVQVEDTGILRDVDTPEEYRRLVDRGPE